MKRTVLSGIAFTAALCAGTAFAQTSATNPTSSTPGQSSSSQAITMSGCVANATSGTQGFTLSNPIVLPSGASSSSASSMPSSSATAGSSTASTAATHPPTAATPPTSTPPTSATAGTSGTAGTSATRPTGTTGSAAAGAAGTSASSSAFNGYRLSGADLTPYAGKRVEVTGTFAPSSSANSATSASGTSATTMREFRVTSVKPIGGPCQQ